jgi:hypothetical protein
MGKEKKLRKMPITDKKCSLLIVKFYYVSNCVKLAISKKKNICTKQNILFQAISIQRFLEHQCSNRPSDYDNDAEIVPQGSEILAVGYQDEGFEFGARRALGVSWGDFAATQQTWATGRVERLGRVGRELGHQQGAGRAEPNTTTQYVRQKMDKINEIAGAS